MESNLWLINFKGKKAYESFENVYWKECRKIYKETNILPEHNFIITKLLENKIISKNPFNDIVTYITENVQLEIDFKNQEGTIYKVKMI